MTLMYSFQLQNQSYSFYLASKLQNMPQILFVLIYHLTNLHNMYLLALQIPHSLYLIDSLGLQLNQNRTLRL